jgi:hypothetical protein
MNQLPPNIQHKIGQMHKKLYIDGLKNHESIYKSSLQRFKNRIQKEGFNYILTNNFKKTNTLLKRMRKDLQKNETIKLSNAPASTNYLSLMRIFNRNMKTHDINVETCKKLTQMRESYMPGSGFINSNKVPYPSCDSIRENKVKNKKNIKKANTVYALSKIKNGLQNKNKTNYQNIINFINKKIKSKRTVFPSNFKITRFPNTNTIKIIQKTNNLKTLLSGPTTTGKKRQLTPLS